MTTQLTTTDLAHFTGSETFYKSIVPRVIYTEGVAYLAHHGACYWLIDAIAACQLDRTIRTESFQVWTLTKGARGTATLECTDGDKGEGPISLYAQEIPYTDFPLPTVTLWCVDGVIMLPSEY